MSFFLQTMKKGGHFMRKRKAQQHAALTNNSTPTESLPDVEEQSTRSNHNRPKTGPGSKG